jgi:Ca2+-binding EF-hand superfamily protein
MKKALFAGAAAAVLLASPAAAQMGVKGDITKAQLTEMMTSQLGRVDMNGDGFISKEELDTVLGYIAQSGAPAQASERLQAMFAKFAKDNKVAIADVVAAQMSAFDQADTNHDGKLSEAERTAAMAAVKAAAPAAGSTDAKPAPKK